MGITKSRPYWASTSSDQSNGKLYRRMKCMTSWQTHQPSLGSSLQKARFQQTSGYWSRLFRDKGGFGAPADRSITICFLGSRQPPSKSIFNSGSNDVACMSQGRQISHVELF